jgi:hypothetical protein
MLNKRGFGLSFYVDLSSNTLYIFKYETEEAMTIQTNMRLPEPTRKHIKNLKDKLDLSSDGQVVILAVDRMYREVFGNAPEENRKR